MTIHKAWDDQHASGFSMASLVTRFKKMVKFEIPIGYQDETGFHYGAEPKTEAIKWPQEW